MTRWAICGFKQWLDKQDEKYADSTKQRAATVPRNLVKTWNSQKFLLQFFSTESVTWVIVTNVVPPQIKAYLKKFSKKSVTVLFNWIGDEGDCYKCAPTNQGVFKRTGRAGIWRTGCFLLQINRLEIPIGRRRSQTSNVIKSPDSRSPLHNAYACYVRRRKPLHNRISVEDCASASRFQVDLENKTSLKDLWLNWSVKPFKIKMKRDYRFRDRIWCIHLVDDLYQS